MGQFNYLLNAMVLYSLFWKKKSNIYYFFSEKTVERHCIQCLLLSWNFRCCRLLNASWW